MSNKMHYGFLICIVMVCAALSAFTVHNILSRSVVKDNTSASPKQPESMHDPEPSIAAYFPKNEYGVYILPTADPTYPLRLGPNTVGGVTACERLYNLRSCLQIKKSPLISRLRTPEATAGAGLNTVCGNMLNELADLRPQTGEIGCIW